jgi:hypothetical protein
MERHYLSLYLWRIDHFSRRSSLPELSLCAECHGGREDLKVRARKGLHLKTELVFKFSEPALLAPACEEEAAILQSRCCICSRFLLVPNKCSSQMWKNSRSSLQLLAVMVQHGCERRPAACRRKWNVVWQLADQDQPANFETELYPPDTPHDECKETFLLLCKHS